MGRRIMVVGNGEIPEGVAGVIDAADFVVRFNVSRNGATSGRRTDAVAVCNTGRPANAMLDGDEWRMSGPVAACGEIWSVRDPGKFAALRPQLAISHPELDDFCDDRSGDFAQFAAETGKRHVIVSPDMHDAADRALSAEAAEPYVVPSSGLIALFHIMAEPAFLDGDIILAGFSHEGWGGHPFAAERRVVDRLVASGRIRRLDVVGEAAAPYTARAR